MTLRLITLLALAAATLPAQADFRTVERAYEVRLTDFNAPASLNGALTMKPCSDCDQMIVRVSSATRYLVNRRPVSLPDFRTLLAQVRDRNSTAIIVRRNLQADSATSVSVSLRSAPQGQKS